MKKLSVVLLLGMLVAGCNPDTDPKTEQTPDPEQPYLTLSETSLEFDYLGGDLLLELKHNNDWTATLSAGADAWLSYETEGSSGDVTTLAITAAQSDLQEQRKATITFRSEELIKVLNITQGTLTGDISAKSMLFGFLEGSRTITVTTTATDWSVSPATDEGGAEVNWCYAEKGDSETVSVTVDTNKTAEKRKAKFTVTAGALSWDVAVTQDEYKFDVSTSGFYFEKTGGEGSFTVNTTVAWTFTPSQGSYWMTVEKTGANKIIVTAQANNSAKRTGTISIDIDGFSHSISVTQLGQGSWADKEVSRMHEATVGNGVNLILMGDGYTITEMDANGKYERDMKTAMDAFFSVYPYTVYKDYFNVWMVGAVSKEAGLSTSRPAKDVDTVFSALWAGPLAGSTSISYDQRTVQNYAKLVSDRTGESMDEMTTVIALNDYVYAGTCFLGDGRGGNFSVALCPVGAQFEALINHEAGGHGFGKLMDEYIYNPDDELPEDKKQEVLKAKGFGWYFNVDLHDDILDTCWAGFANNPKYSMVGTYPGGYMYGKGIWRPEFNSCMNNNIPYYNAPSRYAIVQRIHDWAGLSYTLEEFLVEDEIPPYPAGARMAGDGVLAPLAPLTPPVVVDRWDYEL